MHFVRPNDALEQLWEGVKMVPAGLDVGQFESWLKQWALAQNLKNVRVATWGVPPSDLSNTLGKILAAATPDPDWQEELIQKVDQERRLKDLSEIELLRKTAAATRAGFERAVEWIRPGVTERELQIEIESAFFKAGADETGYGSIVGSGNHSAVLHFDPSSRVLQKGECVLIDAGAAMQGYCSDVTRVYPVDGRFSASQKDLYDLVLAAQKGALSLCVPGTEWHAVHRKSAEIITEGLIALGLLRGTVQDLLEQEATRLFFPHGVGHMVGLGVRDVGGRAPGRKPRQVYGVSVRVDFPLEENQVMTVEPGIYFIDALLDDPSTRMKWKTQVAWDQVDRFRKESKLGGIRIEDDIVVRAGKPEILTEAIPKEFP